MVKAKTKTASKTSKTQVRSAKSQSAKSKGTSLNSVTRTITSPKHRGLILVIVGLILFFLILYLGRSYLVAATVNGEPVSRILVIKELEKQSGKAVLDTEITKILVKQEAGKKNIIVTDAEVNQEIDKIRKQFSDQGQDLDALMEAQGLTQEKFRDEVKIQITVKKLLGNEAKVTDQEFKEFMEANKDLVAEGENQEQAQAQLREQLEQQKLAQKYQEWIMKVRQAAKINLFLNY